MLSFYILSRSTARYTYTTCYNTCRERGSDQVKPKRAIYQHQHLFFFQALIVRLIQTSCWRHTSTCIVSTSAAWPLETSRIIRFIDEIFLGCIAGVVVFGP